MHLGKLKFSTDFFIANGFNMLFSDDFNKQSYEMHGVPLKSQELVCLAELLNNIKPELIDTLLVKLKQTTYGTDDNFHCKLLKSKYRCVLSSSLPHFLLHFLTLKFPDIWKTAFVIPLFKYGARNLLENYRPISLLPKISIIFERIFSKHLYHSLKHRISPKQIGF